MDTGNGTFNRMSTEDFNENIAALSSEEERFRVLQTSFHIGEEIQVKGSRFKVTKITPKKLILRLLPWDDKQD